MKRLMCVVSGLAFSASAVFAQAPPQPPMQMAPQKITLAGGLQRSYNGTKQNLTQSLEKMPEESLAFKPMPEVRAFGQLFGHVANSMYGACSAVKGVTNPNQGNDIEKKTTKAEFQKALADAFAFCDDAFSGTTDENVAQTVKQGQNDVARGAILANIIGHNNEMYGTSVVYLRLKGIVPPSTERMQQMRRPGGQ